MKKILFVAGITIVGLSAAFAQEVKQKNNSNTEQTTTAPEMARKEPRRIDPETMATRRADRLEKELGLDAKQKKSVHDIFLKDAQQNSGRLAQRDEVDKEVKAVLTEEQNKKYEELKSARKQMVRDRSNSNRAELKSAPTPVRTLGK